jgi:Tol biopolymer transport system component
MSAVQIAPAAESHYEGLTFSRDGDFLYCVRTVDHVGVLSEIPVLGGPMRTLITGVDSSVTLSPNGKQFAFLRGFANEQKCALMIADADGRNQREFARCSAITASASPAWSPDGSMVMRIDPTVGDARVLAVPPTGGPETLIFRGWRAIWNIAWLSKGPGVIINGHERANDPAQLWLLSHAGSQPRRITNDLNRYLGVNLTSDSRSLVTVMSETLSHVWVAPIGMPGSPRQITSGSGGWDGIRGISWMPDGRIVYASAAGGRFLLSISDVSGGPPKTLGEAGGYDTYPRVSPDGRYIYFILYDAASGLFHIGKMNSDGSEVRRLTNGKGVEIYPDCSPDGKWVVYSVINSTVEQGLWKISSQGGEAVQLTKALALSAAISPDGTMVAFYDSDNPSRRRLAIMPLEGGQPPKVFDSAPEPVTPFDVPLRWAPGGSSLLYISNRGGSNVWRQPISGGPPQRVTDFQSEQTFFFDVSRDGKWLALARGAVNRDVVLIRDRK